MTKSAWASKINWTQALTFLASFLIMFGIDISPETQGQIVVGIQAVQTVVTMILRTFTTQTPTPQAVK